MSNEHDQPSPEEGFLGRWARRKEAARVAAEPSAAPNPAIEADGSEDHLPAAPRRDGTPGEGMDDAPSTEPATLTDADMPDIETLQPDSDVSGFFSPGVSDALRRKALRKLFHSSRFNVKDGLDDYDDDYTQLQPLGNTMTHDLRRQNERLAERQRAKEAREAAEAETETETEAEAETENERGEDAETGAVSDEDTRTAAPSEVPAGPDANPPTRIDRNAADGGEEDSRA